MSSTASLEAKKLKLNKLIAKKKELEAEAKKLKSVMSKEERAAETKRKMLLGTYAFSKIESGDWSEEDFLKELDEFLTRDIDRKLFGLSSKKAKRTRKTRAKTKK